MGVYGGGIYGAGLYGGGEAASGDLSDSHAFLPEVYLQIPGSPWPADPDLPIGTGRVGTFSVEREIVASSMPGQIRARTGFSIGDAQVSVRQADGRPFAPWAANDRHVAAGAECRLYARDEATGQSWSMGAWQTKRPSGSLLNASLPVQLIESQYAGRKDDARLPTRRDSLNGPPTNSPVDPVWIVDQLARQAGFFSTPPMVNPFTILTVPLCGSLNADSLYGMSYNASGTTGAGSGPVWSMATGIPGLASATVLPQWVTVNFGSFARTLMTVNVAGTVTFQLGLNQGDAIDVEVSTGAIRARINGGSWSTSRTFTPVLNADWPMRVQIIAEASGSNVLLSARSSATGATSTAITLTPAFDLTGIMTVAIASISAGGGVSALDVSEVYSGSPAELWAAPNARMSVLDGTITAAWLPSDGDVWAALQAVCGAWMGAGWVSRDGILTVANRHQLAGSGRPKTLVDVGTRVEDLAWSVDADDCADRLEVTWYPVTWTTDDDPPSEWPVGEKLHVPAGKSVTVKADLGVYVTELLPWYQADDLSAGDNSQWDANTISDGSGTVVATKVTVTTEQTSPSTARVTVTNTNAVDVWMVDPSGDAGMILRGTGASSQDAPQVIEYGATVADATSALQVDLGRLVQTATDAAALAGYLWERVNRPRFRIDDIRTPLDWDRDLGDILTLTHPDSGLSVNVVVIRDSKTGTPGAIEHRNALVLLPPTWDDFDAAWAGKTGTAFDAAWLGSTGTAFDNDPLKTEA